jgi:hypothetical protein
VRVCEGESGWAQDDVDVEVEVVNCCCCQSTNAQVPDTPPSNNNPPTTTATTTTMTMTQASKTRDRITTE